MKTKMRLQRLGLLSCLLLLSTPSFAIEQIFISLADPDINYHLYRMNPDGTGLTSLYNFSQHPSGFKTGKILKPRVSADGKTIWFSSDHAKIYTPTEWNIFQLNTTDNSIRQITPSPNSGVFNQGCPCGSVSGRVMRRNGRPYSGSPVFLEGMPSTYSDSDGRFRFDNVPIGLRWLMAYEPGDYLNEDSIAINVSANRESSGIQLIPVRKTRLALEQPVPYKERLYYKMGIFHLYWLDLNDPIISDDNKKVYEPGLNSRCTLPFLQSFDVGQKTGHLLLMDYREGCSTNRGIYLADKDGQYIQLLVDMKSPNSIVEMLNPGSPNIYWSPDESKFAFRASVKRKEHLDAIVIYDLQGQLIDGISFPHNYNHSFYGWSPKGDFLLYSLYTDKRSKSTLFTIPVNKQGKINRNQVKVILKNREIHGATWGNWVVSEKLTGNGKVGFLTSPQSAKSNIKEEKEKKKYADGRVYDGQWQNGKKHGRGVLTLPYGTRYEGGLRDGIMYGRGVLTMPNGSRFEGEFRGSSMHGQGKYTSADGIRYEGEFREDKMHGQGKLIFADGRVYDGQWQNGKYTFADGQVYDGQ